MTNDHTKSKARLYMVGEILSYQKHYIDNLFADTWRFDGEVVAGDNAGQTAWFSRTVTDRNSADIVLKYRECFEPLGEVVMQSPCKPWNEVERLDTLRRLDILDTSPEESLDGLTRLAAMFCSTAFSTVTLIDDDRQWFKSAHGTLSASETDRDVSFCGHAILQRDVFVVEDTKKDVRFWDNPLVTDGPMIRFYAGAPLITQEGFVLGTLCVFDPNPGTLTDDQKQALTLLAQQATDRIEQRTNNTLMEHLGSLLEVSNTYVIMYDPYEERVNYSNPALSWRLNIDTGSNARILVQTLFPDLDYDRYFTPERLTNIKTERIAKTHIQFPNEAQGKAELRIVPHFHHGQHTCLLLFNDQTELNRARNLVEDTQSNLRVFNKVAQQSINSVIVTGPDGRVQWVNQSFERISGYTLAEVKGKYPGRLLQGPETSPQDRSRIGTHIRAGKPVVQEILNYSKTGESYWIEIYIEPIRDEHDRITHYVGTQRNITRQKQEEEALKDARTAAEKANRAKSQFLANISHELRTPLNGIMANVEHLVDEVPEPLKDSVESLDRSSRHLLNLLNDLIDLSQIESNNLVLQSQPFRLDHLLTDVERLFRGRAQAVGTEVTVAMASIGQRTYAGDATRLKQVFINLVSNAVKFTQGGQVVIKADLQHDETLDDGSVQSRILFAVADTGPGISREHQQRVFENFEQLDNSNTRVHGGSGLGLAISRRIVKAMNSDILLDSQPGKGSTFSFVLFLPLMTPAAGPESAPENRPLRPVSHALVVDDNEINRKVLIALLERLGFTTIYSAPSAKRGLALLDNIHPELMFVDLHMPEINGIEFVRLAKQHFATLNLPAPPAIACTADVADHHRQNCLDSGFDEHLGKPITSDAVSGMLAKHQLKPAVAKPLVAPSPSADAPSALAKSAVSRPYILDVEALQMSLMGSDELVKEFLTLLLENLPTHISHIQAALRAETLVENYGAAHSIKGLVGYFANAELVQTITTLEGAMKAGDASEARIVFSRAETLLHSLLDQIKAAFPDLAKEG